jgi:hypothetical protein
MLFLAFQFVERVLQLVAAKFLMAPPTVQVGAHTVSSFICCGTFFSAVGPNPS